MVRAEPTNTRRH